MTTPPLNLFQATPPFLEPASALFDLYRQFYGQPSDMEGARRFIGERLEKGDSAIFLAYSGDYPVGFFQLYPSFTSAWMQRVWILNDIYVVESARKGGLGRMLMKRAIAYAKETGAKRITLNTAKDNLPAQKFYEATGFRQETVFWSYTLDLD